MSWQYAADRMKKIYGQENLLDYLAEGFGAGVPIMKDDILATFIALLKIAPEPVWDDIERLHDAARMWHGNGPALPVPPADDPPAPTLPEDVEPDPSGPIKVEVAGGGEVEIGTLFEL